MPSDHAAANLAKVAGAKVEGLEFITISVPEIGLQSMPALRAAQREYSALAQVPDLRRAVKAIGIEGTLNQDAMDLLKKSQLTVTATNGVSYVTAKNGATFADFQVSAVAKLLAPAQTVSAYATHRIPPQRAYM